MLNTFLHLLTINRMIYNMAYVDVLLNFGKHIEIILIIMVFISILLAYFYNRWIRKQTQTKVRQQITKEFQENIEGVLDDLTTTANEALEKPGANNSKSSLKRIAQLSQQANASLRKILSQSKRKQRSRKKQGDHITIF